MIRIPHGEMTSIVPQHLELQHMLKKTMQPEMEWTNSSGWTQRSSRPCRRLFKARAESCAKGVIESPATDSVSLPGGVVSVRAKPSLISGIRNFPTLLLG